MEITFCSACGTTVKLELLDSTPLSDVAMNIGKKINAYPESILFSLNGKQIPSSLTAREIPLRDGDVVIFQSSIKTKNFAQIRFAFEDIHNTVDLIDAQRQIFSSKEVLKASKAIYSKEHMNPQEKRQSDPDYFKDMIGELKQLGYSDVRCANALRRANYCIDLAGSLLMDNQEGIQEIAEIIEIMEDMSDISLDNQIESIERKHVPTMKPVPPKTPSPKKPQISQSISTKIAKIGETPKKIQNPHEPPKRTSRVFPPRPIIGRNAPVRSSLPPLRKK